MYTLYVQPESRTADQRVSIDHRSRKEPSPKPWEYCNDQQWEHDMYDWAGTCSHESSPYASAFYNPTPVQEKHRKALLEWIGMDALHVSKDRDFKTSWGRETCDDCKKKATIGEDGKTHLPPVDKCATGQCRKWEKRRRWGYLGDAQYVRLVEKVAPVLVLDVDAHGFPGGKLTDIKPEIYAKLQRLTLYGHGPNLVGVNPINGKCQMIWLIEHVIRDAENPRYNSKTKKLLDVVTEQLTELFGADARFTHDFSRSPFYTGDAADAYHWWWIHSSAQPLIAIAWGAVHESGVEKVVASVMTPSEIQQREEERLKQQPTYGSGRELIEAARRVSAESKATVQAERELLEAEARVGQEIIRADEKDGTRIRGVYLYYTETGSGTRMVARNATAYRHVRWVAMLKHQNGEAITEEFTTNAWNHAYRIAQNKEYEDAAKDGREVRPEERLGHAELAGLHRRIVRFVVDGVAESTSKGKKKLYRSGSPFTPAQHKALATLGQRGGEKAGEAFKTNPDAPHVQARKRDLAKANEQRKLKGFDTRSRVLSKYVELLGKNGTAPSAAAVGRELGISRKQAAVHVRTLREAGMLPDV